MRFVYSLIRFVPDPARGEFVNVGAIVGSEMSSEWQIRQVENPVRARALDENAVLDAVWSFIDRVGSDIDTFDRATESLFGADIVLDEPWLEELHRDHQNVVQLSPPTPMVANSADDAMDRVFDLMVVDPAQRRYRFQKKHVALAAVRSAYAERALRKGVDLRERVMLETSHHSGRFDFAVTNGRALQLTQTWSFQVPDQETLAEQVKAWGWTVRDARDAGGSIVTPAGDRFDVRGDIDVEVVYVPPLPGQEAPALDDARSVFDALEVKAEPIGRALIVAERAHELLVSAGVGRLDLQGN
jgi:hypothetical protein